MSSWNIILCGDLPNTIVLSVTDPAEWTVDNLKQLVIKAVPKATKSDITFYAGGNKQLPEGVPLKECAGVRNGTGLLTIIKPFIIKVYFPDVDGTITVEIPICEFDDWEIDNLVETIRFKLGLGMSRENSQGLMSDDLLVFNGKVLGNDPKIKVSSIPDISNDCLMTYTRFREGQLRTPQNSRRDVIFPETVDWNFAMNCCFYQRVRIGFMLGKLSYNNWMALKQHSYYAILTRCLLLTSERLYNKSCQSHFINRSYC